MRMGETTEKNRSIMSTLEIGHSKLNSAPFMLGKHPTENFGQSRNGDSGDYVNRMQEL